MENKDSILVQALKLPDKYHRDDVLTAKGVAERLKYLSGADIAPSDVVLSGVCVMGSDKLAHQKIGGKWFTTWGAVVDYIGGENDRD